MSDEASLEPLAGFLDDISQPDFSFGEWVPAERPAPGVVTMAYFAFSPTGLALIAAMPIRADFDWTAWKDTDEGRRLLSDPAALAQATPDELVMVSTALLRSDRFTDGALANAWASGMIRGVVERAAALVGHAGAP